MSGFFGKAAELFLCSELDKLFGQKGTKAVRMGSDKHECQTHSVEFCLGRAHTLFRKVHFTSDFYPRIKL